MRRAHPPLDSPMIPFCFTKFLFIQFFTFTTLVSTLRNLYTQIVRLCGKMYRIPKFWCTIPLLCDIIWNNSSPTQIYSLKSIQHGWQCEQICGVKMFPNIGLCTHVLRIQAGPHFIDLHFNWRSSASLIRSVAILHTWIQWSMLISVIFFISGRL